LPPPPGSDVPGQRLILPRDGRRIPELKLGDAVVVEGLIRPSSWVAVTAPTGLAWVRLLPRRSWRLTSM